ncbi:MAG: hypothetical protein ACOVQ4_15150 [Flectobacillus sp.]|uniref:hypothetical protein n=1 Tax=Flectobacillus sp. TaxID=50419 RepID=UPI003B9A9CAF
MNKIYLLIISLILGLGISVQGQSFLSFGKKKSKSTESKLYEKHSSVAFGLGTSHYFGDLAPYYRIIPSFTQDIRWNVGAEWERYLSPHWGVRIGLSWVRIAGDDNKFQGVAGFEDYFMRNIHFRNDIQELSFVGVYQLVKQNRNYRSRSKLMPYLFAGLGVFHHNPMAKAPEGISIPAGQWTSLQPLGTEGQGLPGYDSPYKLFSVSIPAGIGINYKVNKSWDIGLELSLRYTLTDYLDDAGGAYVLPQDLSDPIRLAFSHRELERYAITTGRDRDAQMRQWFVNAGFSNYADPNVPINPRDAAVFYSGNSRNATGKINDSFVMTRVKLVYHLMPAVKCPPLR